MRRLKKKAIAQRGRRSREGSRLTAQQTAHLLTTLLVGIPMAIALGIARWAGWGVDATLIATMMGGIVGAVLLTAVVLGFSR